jgi:GDSL-like Lipase/Acylhydrolase
MKSFSRIWSRGLSSFLVAISFTGLLAAQIRKSLDLSQLVVVGDSLAAGVENGSLEASQQMNGFANVIAEQAGAPLVLPLVPFPGAPNVLSLVNPGGFPPIIQAINYPPLNFPNVRLNPGVQATDLAVPLQTTAEALNLAPSTVIGPDTGETQLATDIVLGFPCPLGGSPCTPLSQVQQAVALKPTAIIIDIGNNDILGAITSGGLQSVLSSPDAFLVSFNSAYASLISQLAATKATLIVANLPDAMEAPYFIPVWKLAQAANVPLLEVSAALGLGVFDYVTLDALPAIEAILFENAPGPLPLFCSATSPSAPCYVTVAQGAAVRLATIAMNTIIALQALAHHATVVDLFSLVDGLHAHGYEVNGITLTTDFLGGLFSLDGLHPTNTGYGIMANRFLETMNASFKTNIPLADISETAASDPLVP